MKVGDEVWILEGGKVPRKGQIEEIHNFQLTPTFTNVRFQVKLWSYLKKKHYTRSLPESQIFLSRMAAYEYRTVQNVLGS